MAYKATTYQAPNYNDKKYSKGINTGFYQNAINNYAANANAERNRQLGEAQKTQQANLRQAYATRLQNEQTMNRNLATQGIRGGASETANLNLLNQYGQARAAANTDYTNSVNQINQSIDKNIMDYTSDMQSRAEEYRQNLAQAKWQADRENKNNEIARQTEYWSNYYINKYSGASKKSVEKAIKDIKAKLKKAKDPMTKIRYQQALSGASARLGVIATSK